MKMKFAICNEMFEGWKFEDICAAAGDAGYGGVELAPYTLGKPVSYTHLDVYKRQVITLISSKRR